MQNDTDSEDVVWPDLQGNGCWTVKAWVWWRDGKTLPFCWSSCLQPALPVTHSSSVRSVHGDILSKVVALREAQHCARLSAFCPGQNFALEISILSKTAISNRKAIGNDCFMHCGTAHSMVASTAASCCINHDVNLTLALHAQIVTYEVAWHMELWRVAWRGVGRQCSDA